MYCSYKDDGSTMQGYYPYNWLSTVLLPKCQVPIRTYAYKPRSLTIQRVPFLLTGCFKFGTCFWHIQPWFWGEDWSQNRWRRSGTFGNKDSAWKIDRTCFFGLIFPKEYFLSYHLWVTLLYWQLHRIVFPYQHQIRRRWTFVKSSQINELFQR